MNVTTTLASEAVVQADCCDTIIPDSPGGENTGCRWMAACCLQLPLSQSGPGLGPGAGSSLQYPELGDDVIAVAGAQILVPGPPHASSLYTHTQRAYSEQREADG